MNRVELIDILNGGLVECNLSKYPFGEVRKTLEALGYTLGTYKNGKYFPLEDGTNGGELDYGADIFFKSGSFTGYTISGSFGYGTCYITKYEFHNESN